MLTFAYVVLVLPYSYRAVDAVAVGDRRRRRCRRLPGRWAPGWFTVIVRIILPNITGGVLGAAFISVALVLGEYVFASLLHFDTLPVAMAAHLQEQRAGRHGGGAGLDGLRVAAARRPHLPQP